MPVRATRVLVIDDDAVFRSALSALLEADGIDVCQAASAHEAIRELSRSHFDAVLTDMVMPGGGQAVLEHLADHSSPTPVAVISSAPPRDGPSSVDVTWLVKPVTLDEVRTFLRAHAG